jgi:hypothetical protein
VGVRGVVGVTSAQGDLTDQLIATSYWTDEMLAAAGIPVYDVPLVTVGGGMGSFALVDLLRTAGIPASSLRILTGIDRPYETYSYLARNSQIPDHERLRSDSASVIDNIWGWPSYALREAFAARSPSAFLAPLFQVATEPVLTDYYTPQAAQVYRSVDREMARIGYWSMVSKGQVRMVRKRIGGGYVSILTPPEGTSPTRRVAFRSQYVHIAVGYPGLKFLPDLQAYLQKYNDYRHVVNAYSPHDYVYEELIRRGGTVLVRGAGIVASRVLQRLMEDVERHGARTQILHLFRTYQSGKQGPNRFMQRTAADGVAYQGFNWPKAAWGGQLRERLEKADDATRAEMLKIMGGTTTPKRKLWQQEIGLARQKGYYRQFVGEVVDMAPGADSTVVTRVQASDGSMLEVPATFVIDCTGLEAALPDHRLLNDLLVHGGARQNLLKRLDVSPGFEIRGTENEPGRMCASGAITLGGYYAGVDSFLGLQYAALRIADGLAARGFGRKIGPGRSISQWWRWVLNRPVD